MQLTRYTDYAVRTLVYLSLHRERLATITEIAEAYGISRNHLVKVVHALGKRGFIETYRGKRGGIRLAREPEAINVADVVRQLEERLDPVKCDNPPCPLISTCRLSGAMQQAMGAFFQSLSDYTVADLVSGTESEMRDQLIPIQAIDTGESRSS